MRADVIVRLILPLFFGFAGGKAGWMYGVMFQRDQPLTPFQKTMSKYFGWFTLGMSFIVLWQFELSRLFGWASAWRWLLGLWVLVMGYVSLRGVGRLRTQENETEAPDFRKP